MPEKRSAPAGENVRYLLGDGTFRFACHRGVVCFTRCCYNADMYLYPMDIIRLKERLDMTSGEFLARHTITAFRENPYFPNVMLKMTDRPGNPCAFLSEDGCTVYEARPYSCRAYPLEPAIYGNGDQSQMHCYVVCHSYCHGHREDREWTAAQWMENQQMDDYNEINARWARVNALFCTNLFGEKPEDSPALKMAYMASYNIDIFRRFVFDSSFLSRFHISQERLHAVRKSDTALLLLGLDWILRFLSGQGSLEERLSGAPS